MITYRILLVITAACSALITAVFINPANSNGLPEPIQFLNPHTPYTLDDERNQVADPLTLAIRICTANSCEDIALNPAELQHFLATQNEDGMQSRQFQRTVPFQLPQQGVPIIEM